MLNKTWDYLVRLRTWLIGTAGLVALYLPDILQLLSQVLNAPEIIAVLPDNWKTWVGAIGFIALVWSRWRPATRTADAEVQVKQALKGSRDSVEIAVRSKSSGRTKAVIDA